MNYTIKLLPVHMMSMPGSNFEPIVLRYSEVATLGTALEAQYSVDTITSITH